MPRRKQPRLRGGSLRPAATTVARDTLSFFDVDLDDLGDLDDDLDDDLHDLHDLEDIPWSERPVLARPRRPVRADSGKIGSSALGRAWAEGVATCGATEVEHQLGLEDLFAGAVVDLAVHHGHITAEVQRTRLYHVRVDFAPPDILHTRLIAALLRPGADEPGTPTRSLTRLRLVRAILASPTPVLPTPRQMLATCDCLDRGRCQHIVAAVRAFGAILETEPEQLLVLWGLDLPDELRNAPEALVIAPLAPEKRPLSGDLTALFGVEFVGVDDRPSPPSLPVSPPPITLVKAPAVAPALPIKPVEPVVVPVTPVTPVADEPERPDAALPPSALPSVERAYLRVLGIPARTIDSWLRAGVLGPTERPDVYTRTTEANRRISKYLAR